MNQTPMLIRTSRRVLLRARGMRAIKPTGTMIIRYLKTGILDDFAHDKDFSDPQDVAAISEVNKAIADMMKQRPEIPLEKTFKEVVDILEHDREENKEVQSKVYSDVIETTFHRKDNPEYAHFDFYSGIEELEEYILHDCHDEASDDDGADSDTKT